MFNNRLHNLYQKNFVFTPDELQQKIEDAHLGLEICTKQIDELSINLAKKQNPGKFHLRLVEHISTFREKCDMLLQIRTFVQTNLDFFTKVPADEQAHSVSDKIQHTQVHTLQKRTLAEVNQQERAEMLEKQGVQVSQIALDNQQMIFQDIQQEEEGYDVLQSRRNEIVKMFQSQVLSHEDEKENDKISARRQTLKYVAKVDGLDSQVNNALDQMNEPNSFKQLDEDFKESEICDIDDINFHEIDIKPFDLNEFKDLIDKMMRGDLLMNVSATAMMYDLILKCLRNISVEVQSISNKKDIENLQVMKFVIAYRKLELVEYLLFGAFKADNSLLFYQNQDSADWQELNEILVEVDIKNPKKYLKDLQKTINGMCLGGALVSQSLKSNNSFMRFFRSLGFTTYYLVSKKKSKNQFNYFMANPNKEHLGKIFEMCDSQFIKNMYKINIPPIHLKQKIYVPMIATKFKSVEAKLYEQGNLKPGIWQTPLQQQTVEIGSKDPSYITDKKRFLPQKMVSIRILSSIPLDVDFKTRRVKDNQMPKYQNIACCCCFFTRRRLLEPVTKIEKIIIHIHGGGFVSTDSCLHQGYTRMWSNDLGVPVFSIDYRLSPKSPFPEPVNDVFQAYYWIVTQAKYQLGIDPKKIVLIGDSAGGHLCAALVILCILRGFQVPTALILHYPALMLDLNTFYPSTLLAIDDPILSQAFLKFCISSFVKNGDPQRNPLISPVFAPDQILKHFPPTRILACEADPLRDPSYLFALRLKRLGVDTKLIIFKEYIHGFDNLDVKNGVAEFRNATLITEQLFREFLELGKPNISSKK